MRALLIVLAFIACSAESCQQDSQNPTVQHRIKAPELEPSNVWAGLIVLAGAVAILMGKKR